MFLRGFHISHDSCTGINDNSFVVGATTNESRILRLDRTFSSSSLLPQVVPAGSSRGELQKSFIYYLLAKDLMICATS